MRVRAFGVRAWVRVLRRGKAGRAKALKRAAWLLSWERNERGRDPMRQSGQMCLCQELGFSLKSNGKLLEDPPGLCESRQAGLPVGRTSDPEPGGTWSLYAAHQHPG